MSIHDTKNTLVIGSPSIASLTNDNSNINANRNNINYNYGFGSNATNLEYSILSNMLGSPLTDSIPTTQTPTSADVLNNIWSQQQSPIIESVAGTPMDIMNAAVADPTFLSSPTHLVTTPTSNVPISSSTSPYNNINTNTTSTTNITSTTNTNNNNNNNNNNNRAGEPILPNKKRESSLYSGSLRHSVSIKSQLSTATSNRTRPLIRDSSQRLDAKATEEYLTMADGMDSIESALLQRLERIRIIDADIPSDQVAAGLATEHVRALGITHTLDNQYHLDNDKRKVRHMQVQTENTCISSNDYINNNTIQHANLHESNSQEDPETRTRRAEVALEDALDHFEVISGLAYKKLRELWEEKMRWENACMELRDRLVVMEQRRFPFQQQQQQQQQQNQNNDHGHGIMCDDYFLEENEEEDELGLSEFPCSEN